MEPYRSRSPDESLFALVLMWLIVLILLCIALPVLVALFVVLVGSLFIWCTFHLAYQLLFK